MNIAQAIISLPEYAHMDPAIDFRVQDDGDGNGPYLAFWPSSLPEPTPEQLEQGWATYQAQQYREKRAAEYPAIGDQLDAIWKALTPPAGSEAEAMKAKIMAVKQKYPKGGA